MEVLLLGGDGPQRATATGFGIATDSVSCESEMQKPEGGAG